MLLSAFLLQPNAVSSMGTPLQIAAVTQQQEILELLLSHGADPNNSQGSDSDSVSAVDREHDITASVSCCSPFPPALILAASKNDCSCLQLLLQHGADCNATDSEGFTALHCAAETNCIKCAEQLLKAGADWETAAAVSGVRCPCTSLYAHTAGPTAKGWGYRVWGILFGFSCMLIGWGVLVGSAGVAVFRTDRLL